jgi:hypothetical protein
MSHLTHLLADVHKRAPRQAQPFDRISKADLWDRLQAAERALATAQMAAQRAATLAHDCAQGISGEHRHQFLAVRNAAYKARDAANRVQS